MSAAASPGSRESRLRITEVFLSLQGETTRAGLPTVFVRLTGCPLRCQYCDTAYAFTGGTVRELDDLLAEIASHGVKTVCVTGGEPLAQKGAFELLRRLCDAGYSVSLETSGAIDAREVDPRVARIIDVKTPGSAEVSKNLWSNLDGLRAHDEVKFVLCSREDYDWAKAIVAERALASHCTVLFSPSADQLGAAQLADWIVADRPPVRFQVQLHKVLWGNVAGR
jgi:7-carboxy-7-deazaguanine synthase